MPTNSNNCRDQVLTICSLLMDEVIPRERACRDFRSKFPDDVLQENLAGQLWFGAEVHIIILNFSNILSALSYLKFCLNHSA